MPISIQGGISFEGGLTLIINPFPDPGQQEYITPGTYSWTAPTNVTSVCVVCVGGGGSGQYRSNYTSTLLAGGGGGGLGWKNDILVTPGESYTLFVGAGTPSVSAPSGTGTTNPATAAQDSYFISTSVVKGGAGQNASSATGGGGAGGTYTGDGGGNGGAGGNRAGSSCASSGGGGAGGYSGTGGAGGASGNGTAGCILKR